MNIRCIPIKRIPMDGPKNFRDLGGFLNREGRLIRWNRLYRADGMSRLSEEDIRRIKERGIRTIVDLRGNAEREALPDVVPEGVEYRSCPLMKEEITGEGGLAEHTFARSLALGYQTMVKEAPDRIGRAALACMEGLEKGAVVFHCTAGKDRTGILAAILLLLLDVCEEDIIADYQVSHTYNEEGINRLAAQAPGLREYLESAGEDSMLHSSPKNIRSVLKLLNAGNIGSWLEKAGVPVLAQNRFRGQMMETDAGGSPALYI